jgi:hypothetical protein
LDSLGPILLTDSPAVWPIGMPVFIVKYSVIYLAQSLNSHMRDLLFSNNNEELKALFYNSHHKTALEGLWFFV